MFALTPLAGMGLLLSPNPVKFFLCFGLFGALIYSQAYFRMTNNMVVRMDLDPDSETLNIMKLNSFGFLRNKSVRLVDFEKYNPNSLNSGRGYGLWEIQIVENVKRMWRI